MRRLLLLLLFLLTAGSPAHADSGLSVSLAPASVAVRVGESFVVTATVVSQQERATPRLVAHLDVVSLQPDVYVDPEDWSDTRSQFVAPVAAHGSTTLRWTVKAVNAGRFSIHVVVLPVLAGRAGPVVVSSPTYAAVQPRRPINPGGSLGVVLAVPAVVGAGALGVQLRRRRLARS